MDTQASIQQAQEIDKFKAIIKAKNAGQGLVKDFKNFINRGNTVQLAIAFVMGAAFNSVMSSFVGDILLQFVSLMFGKAHIEDFAWWINGTPIYYGKFLVALLNFILIALTIFFLIKFLTSTKRHIKRGIKLLKKGKIEQAIEVQPTESTDDILRDIRELLKKQEIPTA